MQSEDLSRSRTSRLELEACAGGGGGADSAAQLLAQREPMDAAPLLSVRSAVSGTSVLSRALLTDMVDDYTPAEGRALLFAHNPAVFERAAPRGSKLAAVCYRGRARQRFGVCLLLTCAYMHSCWLSITLCWVCDHM
jgi:hypothetical protein